MQVKTLRAVIYCRVSFDKAGDARSIEEQEAACRQEAARRGWKVVEPVLVDNSYSATRHARKERPAWAKLSTMLRAGGVDVLVVWSNSRAQRNLREYLDLRDVCADHGVLWSYSGRTYDLSDGKDRFATGLDALVAERDTEDRIADILRAVEQRAHRGQVHGPLPDGLRAVYDERTGKVARYELDPDRAPILQEAVRRVLAGESAFALAREFNARGLTTMHGHRWNGSALSRLIQNPHLAGLRKLRGDVLDDVTAEWPPVITVEEHQKIAALFADPARKTHRRGSEIVHQGTGVYRCGVCGAGLSTLRRKRADGSKQRRYACPNFHLTRDADSVDVYVDRLVTRFLSLPGIMERLSAEEQSAEVTEAAAEVTNLRNQLNDLREKVSAGKLSLDDLEFFRAQWEPKLAEAERRATPTWLPDAVHDVVGPEAEARWSATSPSGRRAILKSMFVVTIHLTTKRNREFDENAVTVERRSPSP